MRKKPPKVPKFEKPRKNSQENSSKTSNLLDKTVIPLITHFTKIRELASSVFIIRNLREIMDEFDFEMTKGQKETVELLGKNIQENLQQGLENTIEPTLLNYAGMENRNENMVVEFLSKCVDSDGKIAQNDFENCLVEIVKNLESV